MSERFKEFELRELQFGDHLVETAKLDAAHYAETETKYKKQPLKPDYDAMVRSRPAYFGAFLSGELVAHMFYYIGKSYHSDGLMATEDRYYLLQEHRGTGLARRLLKFAEKCLKERGVTDVFQSSKHPVGGPHIGPLLETEGYVSVAVVYHKALI